jgi:hypothetical protein
MKIISILLLFFTLSGAIAADALIELYEAHNYEALKKAIDSYSTNNSYEIMFFRAVFNENGEEAKAAYEKVFSNTNGKLKRYSAKKLMDYYYANGYYDTAKKYQKYLVESETQTTEKNNSSKPVTSVVTQEKLYIQVGAFGLKENAAQLQNMLKTQNIKASIIEKKINGKNLFLVWIKGKSDFESTLNQANSLREKYDLDYRIIKK